MGQDHHVAPERLPPYVPPPPDDVATRLDAVITRLDQVLEG
jgi:hypothetical protein